MLKKVGILIIVVISIGLNSCSPKQSEIIVAEFGDYDITMADFEKAYAKNVGSLEEAKKDSLNQLEKFLGLYVNYKMKLRDAQVRQLNSDKEIVNELNEYKKTIGISYILEKELYNKGIKELYDKRGEELRVSHLLIRTDTMSIENAEQKAKDIINRIKNGASFEEEVSKHSDDQFSKKKGGDIYYITAGSILPDFEEMAYNTPVGSVHPKPLKTKYGFHIIKVTERKKRAPKIKASHILIRPKNAKGEMDDKGRIQLAKNVLEKAKNGEDFAELAKMFSEDPGSKEKGGDLGFFGRRQMVQSFDEAVFKLDVGEVSDLVETQFGYHIIKVTEVQPYPSIESEKKTLRDLYEKTRKKSEYSKLIEKYEEDVNCVIFDDVLKQIIINSKGVKVNNNYWESAFQKENGNSVLFTINKSKYTTDSLFANTIKDAKHREANLDDRVFNKIFDEYKNKVVLEEKVTFLVNNDVEFSSLMNEYENGILIFNLQENEVWNKMRMDSIAIQKLYNETKESYVTKNKVQYSEIFTKSDSLAGNYLVMLNNGEKFAELVEKFSEKKKTKINQVTGGLIDADKTELSKSAYELKKIGDYSNIIKNGNGWSIVMLEKKEPSRVKTFDEAKAEVTSVYQDIESANLENSYISRLNKTYSPSVYYEELKNAYKN